MKVTIQVQASRKPYGWSNVFPGTVTFADRKLIVVQQCGATSFYHADGSGNLTGFRRNHPHAKNVPNRYGRFRVHPASVKRIQALIEQAPLVPGWEVRKPRQPSPKLMAKSKRPR